MADDYNLRKDIDTVVRFIETLESTSELKELLNKQSDKFDIDLANEKLSTDLDKLSYDLTTFDNSLNALKGNLIDFNAELIDFDEDNTNLASDLSKLKDNLLIVLNTLTAFSGDLDRLTGELNGLDLQLNGDSTHDGFVDILQEIQVAIYGGNGYSDVSPSPSSLKGMLDSFGQQLQNIAAGDNKLALSLSQLTGYLTAFQGTLQQFRTKLSTELGSSVYNSLDDEIIKLIYSIASANQDIEEHKDLIEDVQDTIGSSTDTLSDGTLFGTLNNTSTVASAASSKANSVENTITNSVNPAINLIKNEDIPAINAMIGTVDVVNDGSLQEQLTATDGRVDDVNGIIGSSSDSSSANTIYGKIKDAKATASLANETADLAQQTASSAEQTANGVSSVVGLASQIDGTVIENINSALDGISESQVDISNLQGTMYKGTGSNYDPNATMTNPADGTLKKNIDETQSEIVIVQGDIFDVQQDIGEVDRAKGGSLQLQIATIVNEILYNTLPTCKIVATIDERDGLNPVFYKACYVTETGKYYEYTGDDILMGGT